MEMHCPQSSGEREVREAMRVVSRLRVGIEQKGPGVMVVVSQKGVMEIVVGLLGKGWPDESAIFFVEVEWCAGEEGVIRREGECQRLPMCGGLCFV